VVTCWRRPRTCVRGRCRFRGAPRYRTRCNPS
jgi:hypothetical protein